MYRDGGVALARGGRPGAGRHLTFSTTVAGGHRGKGTNGLRTGSGDEMSSCAGPL